MFHINPFAVYADIENAFTVCAIGMSLHILVGCLKNGISICGSTNSTFHLLFNVSSGLSGSYIVVCLLINSVCVCVSFMVCFKLCNLLLSVKLR